MTRPQRPSRPLPSWHPRAWVHRLRAAWFTPRLVRALAQSPPDWPAACAAVLAGARPDAWVAHPDHVVPSREPVLVHVARAGRCELIRALLDRGAPLEAKGPLPFDHTALATALLSRQWDAADLLSRAGARWDTPVEVVSLQAMAAAMALGGLDPSRVRPETACLADLVEGTAQDLSGYVRAGFSHLADQSRARELYAQCQARQRAAALEQGLPPAPPSPAPKPRL